MVDASGQSLNLTYLDSLVISWLEETELLTSKRETGLTKDQKDLIAKKKSIENISNCIIEGNIDVAISLINDLNSEVLKDGRFIFGLQKQSFIELIRSGKTVEQALSFCKNILAPFALDAYPEAYSDFKHAMLCLVYESPGKDSPMEYEWSIQRRVDLAATVTSTLYSSFSIHDHSLILLLKYLLLAHKAYHTFKGEISPFETQSDSLLQTERPPPPPPPLSQTFGGMRDFPPSTVQTVCLAVNVSRADALVLLNTTNGDVGNAIFTELTRIQTNLPSFLQLVFEYAQVRGLLKGPQEEEDFKTRARSKLGPHRQLTFQPLSPDLETKYTVLRSIRAAIERADFDEVLSLIEGLSPGFLESSPRLQFHLNQCRILKLLQDGKSSEAIDLARSSIGPISLKHQDLVQPVKEILVLSLWPNLEYPLSNAEQETSIFPALEKAAPSTLISPLHSSLSSKLSLEEPTLTSLFRYLLAVHREWFSTQMMTDPVLTKLKIDVLKKQDTFQLESSDEVTPEPDLPPAPFDEGSIMQICDIFAIPRAGAIELLTQYGGSVEDAISSLFG